MCGHRKGGRDRKRNVASGLQRYIIPFLGHRFIAQKHDYSSKEKCSWQAPYAAHLHAVASNPLSAWGWEKVRGPVPRPKGGVCGKPQGSTIRGTATGMGVGGVPEQQAKQEQGTVHKEREHSGL